jgi:formate hydrogenlyase subunit 3/multisubunit Na+/H+ antiporter MnhD subunit
MMYIALILIVFLIGVLIYSFRTYEKERRRTLEIIASLPIFAVIISFFTNNNDNNAQS